ncbi:MmpS family transport accessory protein [Mycobacterium spongiae]|uniref:MmpS family transport accessory protein n=1 Tax=Mycobacterium spongiae TaxID=886343 RepID=UPI001FEBAB49|nr:MmpS family transport accessory protein [Mycobacterium spongiae]
MGLIGRISTPLIGVLVVAVAAVIVLRLHETLGFRQSVSGSGEPDTIVSFNPKRILYEILGPPGKVAGINYLDAEAQPHQLDGVALPWSLAIVTTLTSVVANVVAQSDSKTLGCRITVNGVTRDERFVSAHHALTTCLVKSA